MKKLFFFAISLFCASAMSSCDALSDATKVDVTVPAFTVSMDAVSGVSSSAPSAPASRAGSQYTAGYTISLDDPRFAEAKQYARKVVSVGIQDVSFKISSGALTNTLTDIVFSVTGVSTTYTIPSCTLGSTYTPLAADKANLTSLLSAALMKMYTSNSVTINFRCNSDVPAGTVLTVNLNIGEQVTTFNVLK